MKFQSYWHDTAPRFSGARPDPVSGHFDVAVIGGGFTGLNAARKLVRSGATVALLEAENVGAGASGRNGGHLNNGVAQGYADARARLGNERARALYEAYDRSIDMIEAVIAEEGIDCDFRRCGKLKLASKPGHVDGLRANFELIHRDVDPDTDFIDRAALGAEIGGAAFHGAMLYRKAAMMHMGRYATGLAKAARRHGVAIWEGAGVTGRDRTAAGWRLNTSKGPSRPTVSSSPPAPTAARSQVPRRDISGGGSFPSDRSSLRPGP